MIDKVKVEDVKKVGTCDLTGEKNGSLIELFKDGRKTAVYLSATAPGAFKGYHLHKVRAARYVCLKGIMKIILYVDGKRKEYILSADKPQRLYIPANVPTGLQNIGTEESWLINYPEPPYDPDMVDEQVDFSQKELSKQYA